VPTHGVDGLAQANDGVDDDLSGAVPRRGTSAVGANHGNSRGRNVLRRKKCNAKRFAELV